MNHKRNEWKVNTDSQDMRDCMSAWMNMIDRDATRPRGPFSADYVIPNQEAFTKAHKEYKVDNLCIYVPNQHPHHRDIGQQTPERFARESLTLAQVDRLTRLLCEAWFKPRRKEFIHG